jgi:Uma2 family endonuclease
MNVTLREPITVAQYLARVAEVGGPRAELINGQVVEMSPERLEHNEVKAAAYMALRQAIREAGLEYQAVADGMAVQIDEFTVYEPDAAIYAGERLPRGTLVIQRPVVIVEVLSPSSAHSDRSAKLVGYFKLESVAHYLIIDPLSQTVEHHSRDSTGQIVAANLNDGTLAMTTPGISVEVATFFI